MHKAIWCLHHGQERMHLKQCLILQSTLCLWMDVDVDATLCSFFGCFGECAWAYTSMCTSQSILNMCTCSQECKNYVNRISCGWVHLGVFLRVFSRVN